MAASGEPHHEIIIIGGGLTGYAAAICLAKAGFKTVLIDANTGAPQIDGRASAVNAASAQFFSALELLPKLLPHAEPIAGVEIFDQGTGSQSVAHKLADKGSGGFVIENAEFLSALSSAAARQNGLNIIHQNASGLGGDAYFRSVQLNSGENLLAPLIIAADGGRSRMGLLAGIERQNWASDQRAINARIHHEAVHNGIARQWFYPGGPMAVLPLLGGNQSSLVWTDNAAASDAAMALPKADFLALINERSKGVLGGLTDCGPLQQFPVSFSQAENYCAQRFALIGDAARAIHPLAGQGFNLAVRDIAALRDCLVDARSAGGDIGSPLTLERYQRWRALDAGLMTAAVDLINRGFSRKSTAIARLRRAGLAIFSHMPAARAQINQIADGQLGDMPQLLRGKM